MAGELTPFHIRGMTDSAGSPGVEVATTAVSHQNDGSVTFTAANGRKYRITDPQALKLLGEVLNLNFLVNG